MHLRLIRFLSTTTMLISIATGLAATSLLATSARAQIPVGGPIDPRDCPCDKDHLNLPCPTNSCVPECGYVTPNNTIACRN